MSAQHAVSAACSPDDVAGTGPMTPSDRLPWKLAAPVIVVASLALWAGLWAGLWATIYWLLGY
jgi:hypothetical protein